MIQEYSLGWNFDNSYTRLPRLFYSQINPTPVKLPKLIILNHSLAHSLGLDSENLETDEEVAFFAGNIVLNGAFPIAQAYAGHQYGHFTMLGDGRAILLGEHITPKGERFDIQLKGSGRTPYSRRGDGRAVVGPMLREYIISEAMFALGIPTTRSLAVVSTGEVVYRETAEPGAILTRVASSHIRVGTFQYAANWGNFEDLQMLTDYTIKRHYPFIRMDENDRYLQFLREVIKRQAELIAKWQLVGFVHGVMNTDNMTISGETIDYGPCAFMDTYDPTTVFSSIDRYGRYAYGNQPAIASWNLARFAESLLPLLHDNEDEAIKMAEDEIDRFQTIFHRYWLDGMRAKLGIFNQEEDDDALVQELLSLMEQNKADYTNTFRLLTMNSLSELSLFESNEFSLWYKRWQSRLIRQNESKEDALFLMRNSNPSIIPRNYFVEKALEAAENEDYHLMNELLEALKNPFAYSPEYKVFTKLPEQATCRYQTYCGT